MGRSIAVLIALNKPYGVLSQFTEEGGHSGLSGLIATPGVYPAGRLDHDSEGLLLLTDDGILQAQIAAPASALEKRYWCQVEGTPDRAALEALAQGVRWGAGHEASAQARPVTPDERLWSREPPIRVRRAQPTSWLEVTISEGKNRQVRHMTAAIGHPTLRLVRVAIGALDLLALGLAPGESRQIDVALLGASLPGRGTPVRTPGARSGRQPRQRLRR